jgi:hypothetical protein
MELEFIAPRPLTPIAPRPLAPKGMGEHDGPTQADVLLETIVRLAKKEPQTAATKIALRRLVVRCSREIALDF